MIRSAQVRLEEGLYKSSEREDHRRAAHAIEYVSSLHAIFLIHPESSDPATSAILRTAPGQKAAREVLSLQTSNLHQ